EIIYSVVYGSCFFFFQAEDGIRDPLVTGVQTCALPISGAAPSPSAPRRPRAGRSPPPPSGRRRRTGRARARRPSWCRNNRRPDEIGRASCREREEGRGGGGPEKEAQRNQRYTMNSQGEE